MKPAPRSRVGFGSHSRHPHRPDDNVRHLNAATAHGAALDDLLQVNPSGEDA